MQFFKKNYEKILLGLVLFGLVVAVGFLLFLVSGEQQRLVDLRNSILTRRVEPLKPPNLDPYNHALRQAATPLVLDLSTTNKLFNPVRWLRAANGTIFPSPAGEELNKLEITKITPLYLRISLDSVYPGDTDSGGPRYVILVEQQGALIPSHRGRRPNYVSVGEKKDVFTLKQVKGPPDNPASLILELNATGEQITISKNHPFRRVDGYMANLKYPPENRYFLNRRVGDRITVAGEDYYIVAISEHEVVLSAQSNGKKYTIRYNATP